MRCDVRARVPCVPSEQAESASATGGRGTGGNTTLYRESRGDSSPQSAQADRCCARPSAGGDQDSRRTHNCRASRAPARPVWQPPASRHHGITTLDHPAHVAAAQVATPTCLQRACLLPHTTHTTRVCATTNGCTHTLPCAEVPGREVCFCC